MMSTQKKPDSQWKRHYTELLGYSTVGIEMGLAVGIGVVIGRLIEVYWLHGKYSPWVMLFFMAMGLVAAAKAFVRAARELRSRYQGDDDDKDGDDQPGTG